MLCVIVYNAYDIHDMYDDVYHGYDRYQLCVQHDIEVLGNILYLVNHAGLLGAYLVLQVGSVEALRAHGGVSQLEASDCVVPYHLSRTEPNRTEPNRTEPNRTEPNRTEPNRTEPTEPNRAEQNRTETNRNETKRQAKKTRNTCNKRVNTLKVLHYN